MSWFKDTVIDSVTGLVAGLGKAIDDNVTSDEEKMILRNELEVATMMFQDKLLQADVKADVERTKRWESDNKSGSLLARNIRPLSLVFVLSVFTLLAFTDGNVGAFNVKPAYVDVFEALLYIVFGAYFTSRGLEKISLFMANRNDRRK